MIWVKRLSFLVVSVLLFSIFSFSSAYAAIDHFKVTISPTSAKIGEWLDLTIEALDKSEQTVADYVGTVIVFSETDKEAEFPNTLQENTYEYKVADQGKVKFENAVKFKHEGKQSIHVYDLNDDKIMGMAEVTIAAGAATSAEDISILSPETWLTVATNKVTISGPTKKNHRVSILVNNKDEVSTTSTSEGTFEQEVTDLQDGENTFKAFVLDADNKKIGESTIVSVKIASGKPKLQSFKVTPNSEVEAESDITIEAIADKWLASVSATIDDVVVALQEGKDGVYLWKTKAPKKEGSYKVDIVLKNDLGGETKELWVDTIKVIPALNAPEVPKVEPKTETGVTLDAPKKDPLKITGLKLTELKTKSVLTWDPVEHALGYNIYKKTENGDMELIESVKEASFTINITGDKTIYDYFYVRAFAKDPTVKTGTGNLSSTGSEQTYEWDLSDATKIKTGPEMYIILGLIALILTWLFFMVRRKTA
jgi:hypothetical protein